MHIQTSSYPLLGAQMVPGDSASTGKGTHTTSTTNFLDVKSLRKVVPAEKSRKGAKYDASIKAGHCAIVYRK